MSKIYTLPKLFVTSIIVSIAFFFTTSAVAKPGKPGEANIVEIAAAVNGATGEFEYLLAAVGCLTDAEGNNPVIDLLSGEDKFTLFAPTNGAFENLQMALGIDVPAPGLTCAVDDIFGAGTVLAVLGYHVTEGRRFSNSAFNRNNSKEIEMLMAGSIVTTPELAIWDGAGQEAGLVDPLININASNGVIHVIDTVLLPFAP